MIDNGKPKDITLTLAGAPETRPRDEQVIKDNSPFEGATVGNLSPRLAYELKLNTQTSGVAITAVADGSVAQRLGFQPGDIIVSINGTEVTSSRDMVKIAAGSPAYWRIEIDRNGQRLRQMYR